MMTQPSDFAKSYLAMQGVAILPDLPASDKQQPGKIVEAGVKQNQKFSLRDLK